MLCSIPWSGSLFPGYEKAFCLRKDNMPSINAIEIQAGNVLEHNGKLWVVARKPEHVKPGKGGAFVQVEMKEILSGTKLNTRFRSSETVERVRLDQKDYQYLYAEGDLITLMDNETFEQILVNRTLAGEAGVFLQEGMIVTVEAHNDNPLKLTLPDTVILAVMEAEPVVKGQTAASSYKPAIMENGVRVMVPPFIEVGEKIVVKTEDGTYVERAKK